MGEEMQDAHPPVVGWTISSGRLDGINEDGVVSVPVVAVALHIAGEAEGEAQTYNVPAPMAHQLSEIIGRAATHSLVQWDPVLRDLQDKASRRRRLSAPAAVWVMVAVMLAFLMALAGYQESQRYMHVGGVFEGVAGALGFGWQIAGIFLTMSAFGRWLRRVKDTRTERKAARAATPSDAPDIESLP